MLEDLPFRQFVERLMGQRHASGRKVGQDRDHGLFREPAVGGDGMLGGSNVVPQREQLRVAGRGKP